jgi:hypothetical protein
VIFVVKSSPIQNLNFRKDGVVIILQDQGSNYDLSQGARNPDQQQESLEQLNLITVYVSISLFTSTCTKIVTKISTQKRTPCSQMKNNALFLLIMKNDSIPFPSIKGHVRYVQI